MSETAESHICALTTNRVCVIEITNVSSVFCLYNPKVHMESGFVYSPPTPTLRTTKAEVCSFTKDDNTASGAVGVMTYDLFDMQRRECSELLVLMFSVPFDYNFYTNWCGIGIFPKNQPCNDKLFDNMYNGKDFTNFVRHKADGSGIVFQGRRLDVRASMSDEGRAIVKMELFDKFD